MVEKSSNRSEESSKCSEKDYMLTCYTYIKILKKGMVIMANKRGNGEGTISKRENGTWCARITIGRDSNGKQKRKAFYGKTRKEVQEKMTAALNEINNGTYAEPTQLTLAEWLNIWLSEYALNSIKQSTRVSYDTFINKHINPIIGNIKLQKLRPDIIQKFYNDKLENGRLDGKGGLSPKTIKKYT